MNKKMFLKKSNKIMKKSDFYFDLPAELIAQTPLKERDSSRLLVMDKNTGATAHRHFYNLVEILRPGDLLILNDTRVLPARLFGTQPPSAAPVEVLLLNDRGDDTWECLTRPGKKTKTGKSICFGDALMRGYVIDELDGGSRLIKFDYDKKKTFLEMLSVLGTVPLPPYIKERLLDPERYQTVYAKELGSAAAPTAGLHFTKELLNEFVKKGIGIGYVTLHIGIGTFRPVKADDISDHVMHSEYYEISEHTAQMVNDAKKRGGRVIAVGTTACRSLESAGRYGMPLAAIKEYTDIFIYPGYSFKVIDALVTNFHLPESTLIMLVSAFSSRENILRAYQEAICEKYRFFSFGDSMFIGNFKKEEWDQLQYV